MNLPVTASTKHMWNQHRPSPTALPVSDVTRTCGRQYHFKTIDMGGVEQSHHQERIGPWSPFLITTVTQRQRQRLKKKSSNVNDDSWKVEDLHITKEWWEDDFLILGFPTSIFPSLKMWNKRRSKKLAESHLLFFFRNSIQAFTDWGKTGWSREAHPVYSACSWF